MKRTWALLAVACSASAALGACTCEQPETRARDSQPARLAWYGAKRDLYDGIPTLLRFAPADEALARRVWAAFAAIGRTFNDYQRDSEVSRINAKGGPVRLAVSREMAAALRLSLRAHALTGGAFDITVRPLRQLWKRAAASGKPPSADALARVRAAIGSDKLALAGRTLSIRAAGMSLDFGGIIKGIAVDEVVRMLRAARVRAYLVQLGGQTAVFGRSARGRPHVIGIEDPRAPPRLWTRIVDPGGGFCGATSSNAHRAIRVGGKPYYHILDPHSGQPAHATLLFVSVVFRGAARCWLADALSTACATMQPARALRLVERLGGDALIVRLDKSGRPVEYKSRRWNDLLYRAAPGK